MLNMLNLLFALAVATGLAVSQPVAMTPPSAEIQPKTIELFQERLVDDYYWLRDKKNPKVIAYLEAENAYTDSVMQPTKPLQEKIYNEMLSRIKETDEEVPYLKGGYYYYSRTEKGKQYPICARKKGDLKAREEVLLDLNELAKGQKFMAIGAFEISDDGQRLVYSTDNVGFRQYTLFVKDLKTGRLFPETISKTGSIAWAVDNKTIFYTVEDAAKRQYRVYRHVVGAGADGDKLVYEEKDERFETSVSRSRSRDYLFLGSESHTATEFRYLKANDPEGSWQVLAPRLPEHEYYPEHRGGLFYIRSNKAGRNFRIVTAPVSTPSPEQWKELVPHRPGTMIEALLAFKDYCVLFEREKGLPQLSVLEQCRWESRRPIPQAEAVYDLWPGDNKEFNTSLLRYRYQSMVTPDSVYDYDMGRRSSILLKRKEVPNYNPALYNSERIYATAPDGIKVPISVLYRKGFKPDGEAAIYLVGYGSYGYSMPANFSSSVFSMVDRGAIFARAHVRGGGDMGKAWHDDGRMRRKKNTFTDFIAVAEHLVAKKYGARGRLVIAGGSAGGLLMGAVVNMKPELFKAAVMDVPFVDVINTMLDESLPLTVGEFEEWGNPKEKEDYEYMRSYSPYDNLKAQNYPAILVKTSLHDSQVMYWEPAKYVAKLRRLKTDQNHLLLQINMAAGHGGASGRYDFLREIAFDYAFMLTQMGIAPEGR